MFFYLTLLLYCKSLFFELETCLPGSSKKAPRILFFPIALGAEYLSYVKSIATYAPQFFGYNNSVLAIVVGTPKLYFI